jgi:hypothetical protein
VPWYGAAWLVQQLASGRTLSFGGVSAGGRLIAVAVSEYRRTWPPRAGNVSFSITIEPPPGLEHAVEVLLRELGWEGMFELELIEDDQGTMTPIDLNPRPYGSMALAIAAGANLPAVWCDWVLGREHRVAPVAPRPTSSEPPASHNGAGVAVRRASAPASVSVAEPVSTAPPPSVQPCLTEPPGARAQSPVPVAPPVTVAVPPTRAHPSRRYRWEDADLRHLIWQLERRHWQAALRPLRPWPRVVHAYFRLRDPLPLAVRSVSLVVGKLRARIGALRN